MLRPRDQRRGAGGQRRRLQCHGKAGSIEGGESSEGRIEAQRAVTGSYCQMMRERFVMAAMNKDDPVEWKEVWQITFSSKSIKL
jgi:hypothetical protein